MFSLVKKFEKGKNNLKRETKTWKAVKIVNSCILRWDGKETIKEVKKEHKFRKSKTKSHAPVFPI